MDALKKHFINAEGEINWKNLICVYETPGRSLGQKSLLCNGPTLRGLYAE